MGNMLEFFLPDNDFCEPVKRTEGLAENDFRIARTIGLGGSDAGGLMPDPSGEGYLNPYKSPFIIGCEKLGLVNLYTETDATRRGKRLEPRLREWFPDDYKAKYGHAIEVFRAPMMYRSKRTPFACGNLDGIVLHPEYGPCVLEIKTAIEEMRPKWENNEVPDSYYAQVQHYLWVSGLKKAFVYALIGDDLPVIREVDENPAFQADMIAYEGAFWQTYIVPKVLPEPCGYVEEEAKYQAVLYGDGGKSTDFPEVPDILDIVSKRRYEDEEQKRHDAEKKRLDILIKDRIGHARGIMVQGTKISWTRSESDRFDSDKFKAEHPELWLKYRKPSDFSRLYFSFPKQKEA